MTSTKCFTNHNNNDHAVALPNGNKCDPNHVLYPLANQPPRVPGYDSMPMPMSMSMSMSPRVADYQGSEIKWPNGDSWTSELARMAEEANVFDTQEWGKKLKPNRSLWERPPPPPPPLPPSMAELGLLTDGDPHPLARVYRPGTVRITLQWDDWHIDRRASTHVLPKNGPKVLKKLEKVARRIFPATAIEENLWFSLSNAAIQLASSYVNDSPIPGPIDLREAPALFRRQLSHLIIGDVTLTFTPVVK